MGFVIEFVVFVVNYVIFDMGYVGMEFVFELVDVVGCFGLG